MITYSGTMVTTFGTISVARYTQNSASRPGNRSRANAYAPIIENATCPAVRIAAVSTVLPRNVRKFWWYSTWLKFVRSRWDGGFQGRSVVIPDSGLNAANPANRYGATNAATISSISR